MPKDKKPKPMISETKATYRPRRRPLTRPDRPKGDFWNPLTLDELIKQQGTKPFRAEDIGKKADFWPPDEDVEEFLKAAMGDRYKRK